MKRTPLKRSGRWGTSFASMQEVKDQQAAKNARLRALMDSARAAPPVNATYAGTTAAPQPKAEKAKTGKYTPNLEEKRWLDAITSFGCIACWLDGSPRRDAAVHHLLRGGRRLGHLRSLPLCDSGHHQNGQSMGMISRHPHKARFEAKYGTEQELLEMLRKMLGFTQEASK